MFELVENLAQNAKIKVVGVGGGGGNAINTMISAGMEGVEFVAANTDSQVLDANLAGSKVYLGGDLTRRRFVESPIWMPVVDSRMFNGSLMKNCRSHNI